jgi:hypothetical protein
MACAFDSRFISGLSNNDPVTTWTDRTSNARNATQATAAKKPTYKTGELNGNPGLSFDGGDCLVTSTFSASVAGSAYVIFKASANGLVYERGTTFTDTGASFIYSTTGSTTSFTRQGGVYSTYDRAANWGIGSVWRLVSHENDGTHANHKFYIDGAVQSMTANNTNDPGTANSTLGVNIGSRNNAASLAITGVYAAFSFGPYLAAPLRKRLVSSWSYSFKIASS